MKLNLDEKLHNADWLRSANADFPNGITPEAALHAIEHDLPVTRAPNWATTVVREKYNMNHDELGRFAEGDNETSGMSPSSGGGGTAPASPTGAAAGEKPLTPRQAAARRASEAAQAAGKVEAVANFAERGWTPEQLEANVQAIWDRAQGTENMKLGMEWYQTQHDVAVGFAAKYDISLEQAVGVIASLSPLTEWNKNIVIAERAIQLAQSDTFTMTKEEADKNYARALKNVDVETKRDPENYDRAKGLANAERNYARALELVGTHPTDEVSSKDLGRYGHIGTLATSGMKAIEVMRGNMDAVNGPKVEAFYENILHPGVSQRMTLDTHMGRAIVNNIALSETDLKEVTRTQGRRDLLIAPVVAVAEKMGVAPLQVQAVVWMQWKDEHGMGDRRAATEADPSIGTGHVKKALNDSVEYDDTPEPTYGELVDDLIWQGFDDDEIKDIAGPAPKATLKARLFAALGLKFNENHDELGRFTFGAGEDSKPEEFPSRVGSDNNYIANVMIPRFKQWGYSLNGDQQNAVIAYTESSAGFNQYLRGQMSDADLARLTNDNGVQQLKGIEDLTDALDKAHTDRDYITFRGVNTGVYGNASEYIGLHVGDQFIDKAFVSTSLNSHVAGGWGRGEGGIVFRITVPEGSHAASPNAISGVQRNEGELLIQRGSTFEVTKVTENYTLVSERPNWQEISGYTKDAVTPIDKLIDIKLVNQR